MEDIFNNLITNPAFFAIAFLVNILIKLIKDVVEGMDLVKNKGQDVKKGIPTLIFRNILILLTMIISFGITYMVVKLKWMPSVGGSIVATSILNAFIAIIMYEIGVKEILEYIKSKIGIINKEAKKDENK